MPEAGDWVVACTDGTDSDSQTVTITTDGQSESVNLGYQLYASDFDWSSYGVLGTDYEIVYDDDTAIPESEWATAKNWKARLLTSNTLTPTKDGEIDAFLVGGGGPAVKGYYNYSFDKEQGTPGSGGNPTTASSIFVTRGVAYAVTIGGSGGYTRAFGNTGPAGAKGGATSGTPSLEFSVGPKTYALSGTTVEMDQDLPTIKANTGNGANVSYGDATDGASGIVIIRNARGEAA